MGDGPSARQPSHGSWPIAVAFLVPPIVLAVALLIVAAEQDSPGPSTEDLWIGERAYGPVSSAPASQVERAHEALHAIGDQCRGSAPDQAAVTTDVATIIDFAQRFPDGRFPIDDETATSASLLRVTRNAIDDCAPSAVTELDRALRQLSAPQD